MDTNYLATGDRVETDPGTDAWMRGDRFGTVERIYLGQERAGAERPVRVVVKLDRSNRSTIFVPSLLTRVHPGRF